MKDQCWKVSGVHEGKLMSELPITYLMWFVGSPIMRRTRWNQCQIALSEIRCRLLNGTMRVETELVASLKPKTIHERYAIKMRQRAYRQSRI